MSDTSTGSCLCGASTFSFEGSALFAVRCYCRDCQHASGGGHMPQMGVTRHGMGVSGPIKIYETTAESGNALGFHFCGECGSPLFKTTSMMPDKMFVNAGALDAPPDVDFSKRVYEEARQPWDRPA